MTTAHPLDGVTPLDVRIAVGHVELRFLAPEGRESEVAAVLSGIVNGALYRAAHPHVTTRMEQPPTDANGSPVEPSR